MNKEQQELPKMERVEKRRVITAVVMLIIVIIVILETSYKLLTA